MVKGKNLKVKILLIGPSEVSMNLVIISFAVIFKTNTGVKINVNNINSVGKQFWEIFSLTPWRL